MGTIYDAFHSAKSTAANIPQPGEQGSYTIPAFLEDFPQFCQEKIYGHRLRRDPA